MKGFNTNNWKRHIRIWKGKETMVVDFKSVGRYLSKGWSLGGRQ